MRNTVSSQFGALVVVHEEVENRDDSVVLLVVVSDGLLSVGLPSLPPPSPPPLPPPQLIMHGKLLPLPLPPPPPGPHPNRQSKLNGGPPPPEGLGAPGGGPIGPTSCGNWGGSVGTTHIGPPGITVSVVVVPEKVSTIVLFAVAVVDTYVSVYDEPEIVVRKTPKGTVGVDSDDDELG